MPRSRFATALSPAGWRAWLGARPHVQRVVSNTGWLLGDRIFRIAVGLLVGIWVARYLGAEQFGLIAYATAIVTLVTPLASLGLDNIVVRDLVRRQHDPGLTLGTCVLLQLAGSVAAMSVAVAGSASTISPSAPGSWPAWHGPAFASTRTPMRAAPPAFTGRDRPWRPGSCPPTKNARSRMTPRA